MNAEREGMPSARQATSYGPHAKPGHDAERAVDRRAAKSPLRKRREIQTPVEPGAPAPHRYGAGF